MKVSSCLFILALVSLLLVSFPFIAACIYTMLTKSQATSEDFVATQQIILQCLLEYIKVLGELFVKTNEQILLAFDQYSNALVITVPKLVSLSLTALTEILNVTTLLLVSSLLVIYGLVFKFGVIKDTIGDIFHPILEAIKEVWLSVKGGIVTIWSTSPASCMFVLVLYALVVISNPKNFPIELINSLNQSQ